MEGGTDKWALPQRKAIFLDAFAQSRKVPLASSSQSLSLLLPACPSSSLSHVSA